MSRLTKQWIAGRKTVWEHKSKDFRIDELTVESEGTEDKLEWASFERGDAVAALIVNTDTNNVILVQQFRPPVAAVEGPEHRLIETMAGMKRQNEEVLQCLRREMQEETGYDLPFNAQTGGVEGVEPICTFYSSPGGSSERIHLFYVAVNHTTPKSGGGGIWDQGERIEPILIPLDQFFDGVDRGAFKDPKIIIAGQWLQKRWAQRKTDSNNKQEFRLEGHATQAGTPRIVGYYHCDIGEVKDVDVWVNSSNTEFLMDSVYHRTLSSRIRALGARVSDDVIVEDTIQQALIRRLGVGRGTGVGIVLETESGSLAKTHKVRRILHVASIKALIKPDGYAKNISTAQDLVKCVIGTLKKCDELNNGWSYDRRVYGAYTSILMPLFGAGVDRTAQELQPQNLSGLLIPAAVDYLRSHPASLIERIYFLAYTPLEVEICDSVLSRIPSLRRLRQAATGSTPAEVKE